MSDRARDWAGLVASWQKSGVSQTEFCRRRGVNAITFSCWKGRLLGQGKSVGRGMAPGALGASAPVRSRLRSTRTGRRAGSFVELRLAEGPCRSGYEVVLSRGRVIRLPVDFDSEAVSRLITAVESC